MTTPETPETPEPDAPVTLDDDDVVTAKDDPSNYSCTCLSRDPQDHLWDCKLWQCWEFENGWVLWDADEFRLVPSDELDDEFDDLNAELDAILNDEGSDLSVKTTKGAPVTNSAGSFTALAYSKCRHYQYELELPDGTIVYASSHHRDRQGDPIPDLGIYLDGIWTPDCVAFLVGCPDYGIPTPSMTAVLHIAREGIRVARDQGIVEVGCIGGHGRTGMMLSIMALLTMDKPNGKQALKYVRDNYCDHAVESPRQEWYIDCVAAELNGEPWPEEPPKPVTTWSYKPADGLRTMRKIDDEWVWGTFKDGNWVVDDPKVVAPDPKVAPASSPPAPIPLGPANSTPEPTDPFPLPEGSRTGTWVYPVQPDPIGQSDGVISDQTAGIPLF